MSEGAREPADGSDVDERSAALPADLAPARIARLLRTRRYGRSLDVRASTGSTNDDARAAADAGAPDGHVVVADAQTRGRGTHGRTWSSPPGVDLYLSIVCRPSLSFAELPLLTLAVGLAVADGVDTHLASAGVPYASGRARVRWPNDVLVGDAKCAGVLVEASSIGETLGPVIVGIGLDVGRAEFDETVERPATSLARVAGQTFDRAEVLATLLERLEQRIDALAAEGPSDVVRALSERLAWRGERVVCGEVEGVLLGIDEAGRLRLDAGGNERVLVSGRLRRE